MTEPQQPPPPAPKPASETVAPDTAPPAELLPPEEPPSQPPARQRRDFFGQAVREMLLPFTGIIERKINPILAALEQIPDDVERLANSNFGLLDQPHSRPARPSATPTRPIPERFLRPPGAMDSGPHSGFESVCSRCAKCVDACPVDAIQLDPNHLVADGFPYIVADTQPCVVCTELACMKSCPTGALQLVDRLHIHMGTALVDHQLCLRNNGENCTLCIDVCPIDGKTGDSPSALFISPDTGKIRVRKNTCIGCGLCENRCPTEPRAITITPATPTLDPIIA